MDTSVETRAELRRLNGNKVMLSFSRGKDSIAAWLALRDDGFEVVPVHLETVPGLAFVRESLGYYERFFGVPIVNMPHPGFLRMVSGAVFQTPARARALADLAIYRGLSYREMFDEVAAEHGCGKWYATGMRASDSMTRRFALKRAGSLVFAQEKAHVIFDWGNDDLRACFRRHGAKLPIDYKMFGRSFDGLDAEYLVSLKQWFPDDYRRVLEFFPLAEVELFRDERMRT